MSKMTTQEVTTMIRSMGTPFAYYQFPDDPDSEAPATPFICFFYSSSDDVYADNTNYTGIAELHIEVYSDKKDFDLEKRVENKLMQHGLTWRKNEARLDSEKMHETIYTTEVILE